MFGGSSEGEESDFAPEPVVCAFLHKHRAVYKLTHIQQAKKPAKKATAPKKAAAPRKAPAKKAAVKKRPAPGSDDDDDDDGELTSTPPSNKKQKKAPEKKTSKAAQKPLKSKENEMEVDDADLTIEEQAARELAQVTAAAAKKNSSETYQKVNDVWWQASSLVLTVCSSLS